MAERLSKLTNEIVVMVREQDWDPVFTAYLRSSGTKQITVDSVRDFRTPFGNYMIIATLSVVRVGPETYGLREYIQRALKRAGLELEMSQVHAPGKAKFYRVD